MPPTQENGQVPPKQENVPVRKVTITIPSAMGGPTSTNNSTTATVVQSPGKKSEKYKPSCTICAQLATCPSPVNPNWLEENKYYYPLEPKYIPIYEETIPILVTGESKSEQQKKKERKGEKNREQKNSGRNRWWWRSRLPVRLRLHLPRLFVNKSVYQLQ